MKEEDFKRIVREGVNEAFSLHGFDPTNPKESQRNMAYLEDMRKGCESIKRNARKTIVTTFFSASIPTGAYLIWQAIKGIFK